MGQWPFLLAMRLNERLFFYYSIKRKDHYQWLIGVIHAETDNETKKARPDAIPPCLKTTNGQNVAFSLSIIRAKRGI